MTKEEEFVVKVFQRSPDITVKEQARKAIYMNNERKFIDHTLKVLKENPKLQDWYIALLGEDLYNELQKFKTEK